jgi:Flp pilus assembly protein CpaB
MAIALAVVLAFVLNVLALQSREATTMVAVADSPIAAGSPLTPDIVRLVSLPADFQGLDYLVGESDLQRLDGWIVGRPVREGELIDRSLVVRPGAGDGLRTMSIPVAAEHAAGATLVVGDRVDVISIIGEEPVFVASDLEVVSIADTTQAGLSAAGPYHVVVGVSPTQALALSRAIGDGSLEILRSTGAEALEEAGG